MQQKIATKIRDKTAGDDWTIRRNIVNIPTGQMIAEAWLTVKEEIEDADSAAIVQKHITSIVDDPGVGQIEVQGGSGTGTVRFDLTTAETVLFKPHVTYYYDIQIKTSTGKYNTPDDGTIIALPQITQST